MCGSETLIEGNFFIDIKHESCESLRPHSENRRIRPTRSAEASDDRRRWTPPRQ